MIFPLTNWQKCARIVEEGKDKMLTYLLISLFAHAVVLGTGIGFGLYLFNRRLKQENEAIFKRVQAESEFIQDLVKGSNEGGHGGHWQ